MNFIWTPWMLLQCGLLEHYFQHDIFVSLAFCRLSRKQRVEQIKRNVQAFVSFSGFMAFYTSWGWVIVPTQATM